MDKIVLICAVGRSGSTTMQRIVNTIPNSNICGENYGALISLLQFYKEIKHTTINYVPGRLNPASYKKICKLNIKPSWYNSYQFKEITEKVREMIIALFKNSNETILWGFKEIRYNDGKIQYIKEFKELFPQTKVIIQIRENIQVQCKSGWFKNDKTSISFIKKMSNELCDFYEQNKDYCYFTTFERMFDKNNIKNIFKFIECEEYYNEDIITSILLNNLKD